MDDELNKRLVELEIKLVFQDELLEQLNQTIIRQQQQLDLLQGQLKLVYQTANKNQQDHKETGYSLFEELPPHY